MSKELEKALDLQPDEDGTYRVPTIKEDKEIIETDDNTDAEKIENDFDLGRDSLHDLIEKSEEVIEDMMSIARQSQHPTAYATLNQMLKTQADLHKDLMSMHSKKKNLLKNGRENKKTETEGETTTNQNIFVGTTAEFAALVDQLKENKDG